MHTFSALPFKINYNSAYYGSQWLVWDMVFPDEVDFSVLVYTNDVVNNLSSAVWHTCTIFTLVWQYMFSASADVFLWSDVSLFGVVCMSDMNKY